MPATDLFSKYGNEQEDSNTYRAFRSATSSVAFFCIWGKDNRRLYYAYPSLNFFALSDKSEKLLLEIGKSYILIKGKKLKPLAHQLQQKTLDYMRELPEGKNLSDVDTETVITQTTILKEFNPDLLLDDDE